MPSSPRALMTTISIASAIILLVYGFLQIFPEHDAMWELPRFHFYVISATLLFATISALAIGWTGIRLRDMNVLFLALAIISLTGFFLIHGLTTPGFIIPDQHHLAGVASQIAMTACAIWIALSTLHSDHPLIRYVSKRRRTFIAGWMAIIVIMNILAITRPDISDFIPIDIEPLNYVIGLVT
ncbi:MAG: metal dependent phosphohydrolase, partial [Paenibacillaceae bacterium]|nr:metal dependent phosphohydrolase [Paenibacillaceae bacterium]